MFKRLYMILMMRRLSKLFRKHTTTILMGDELEGLPASVRELDILHDLENAEALDLDEDWYGNITAIRKLKGFTLYTLARSDLWWNRIISFAAGVATPLIIQAITRTLP